MKYPHTLTPEQFAIISVALDSAREREAAYVEKHEDRPSDCLDALDELRKLWAHAGPVVLSARSTKPPYRLCWHCNRQFQGNHFAVVENEAGNVYVHKQCAKEMEAAGLVGRVERSKQ